MPSIYDGFKPISFQLSPDLETEILDKVAGDIYDALPEDILRAFPDFRIGGTKVPPPNVRLANYTAATVPEDFPLIRNTDYLSQYKQNLLPAPLSPMWNRALGIPTVFSLLQKDFNEVYNRLVGTPE